MANHDLSFKTTLSTLLVVYLGLFFPVVVQALDLNREKVIAEKLTAKLKIGEAVSISGASGPFFGIYTESLTEDDVGVVLILHGMAAHPDWPDVITHLRRNLPLHDWSTLSIQMPLLPADEGVEQYGKTFSAADERIAAAIKYLQDLQYERIVLIGYGFGAATGLRYLARDSSHTLLGMVSVSALAQPYLRPPFRLQQQLESVQIPVLDLYGSQDYERVIESAPDRRLAARKAENIWYQQIEIEGADHTYSSMNQVLVKRIQGWLDKLIDNYSIKEATAVETD